MSEEIGSKTSKVERNFLDCISRASEKKNENAEETCKLDNSDHNTFIVSEIVPTRESWGRRNPHRHNSVYPGVVNYQENKYGNLIPVEHQISDLRLF